jgi:hypothetical protein
MAVMSAQDRADCDADFMRTERGTFGAMTKADLQAALNAADQWASDNAAAFSASLPLPARTVLTASQKARLLAWVILKRYNVGV